MKDRVSLYPGRIRLNPVEGQDNVYDLVRADEPIEEGTPLNKVNILKDSTIQKYINANLNVPDDVFNYIGNYAEYWWRRTSLGTTKYREKQTLSTSSDSSKTLTGNYYYDSVNVDEDTGAVTVNGAGTIIDMTTKSELVSALKNKYLVVESTIIHIESTVNNGVGFSINKQGVASVIAEYYSVVTAESYLIEAGIVSYVHSTDRNAYPDSGDYNGFNYEYVGIPFENMPGAPRIEMGAYVGAGNYGSSNSNSLTFGFVPKIVIITIAESSSATYGGFTWVYGDKSGNVASSSTLVKLTWNENALSWYGTTADKQLNGRGKTYHYVAIG